MIILVVDDEQDYCRDMADYISSLGFRTRTAFGAGEASFILNQEDIALVVTDVRLPDFDGFELLEKHRARGIPFILISGEEDIIRSINAIDSGAVDFLTKPIDVAKLSILINEATGRTNEFEFATNKQNGIVIMDESMKSIYRKLKRLQDYQHIPVLIQGETGTGKEIIARYLHFQNNRYSGPFIGINCSSLTRELFDAELFGYEKGAFTGADSQGKEGKIRVAEGGILFLDEISEIPPDLQAKLLRVIQEREYFKVGGNTPQKVNTRIVCASNRNLEQLVKEGHFREDLYYRLTLCRVEIPPLRDRHEEILPLSWLFLRELSQEFGRPQATFSSDAVKLLQSYSWPGNVRELRNVITNCVLFLDEDTITADLLSGIITQKEERPFPLLRFELPEEPFSLDEFVREIVKRSLHKCGGNKSEAARYLGLTRIQFYGRFKDIS